MTEATITINGTTLTEAQSMTVRVAMATFLMDLHEEGLGNDVHGQRMKDAYMQHCRDINKLILTS